ncbi:DUF1326 domain-containing protein [Peribacillus frigoritolerans]|uniref:DUF1326 domain-containing protein n=1 Tax=Peribacillus frigoritolerans TaxID=450367 RepID=UPI003D029AE5
MVELQPGWKVKGTYNEACAAEGACPYYFGRDVQNGCRYFMVFRIQEGKVNGVDLSGITMIYMGEIPYTSFHDLVDMGSEGEIYISNIATQSQRDVLNTLAVQSIGGSLMKKVFGIEYVEMDIQEKDGNIHFTMPYGELKQNLLKGGDGKTHIHLENQVLPGLEDVKACHTSFWRYQGHNRNLNYTDRCGVWSDFKFEG